jgi:hypothetical protein
MDHNDIRHKLSEYIDNSVTPDEKTAIEAHLPTCSECSDALRELRKTIENLHAVEEVQPPAWMTQKVMAKVSEDAEQKSGLLRRLFYPLAVKLPIQAVAVLFLTITVYYIYSGMHPADRYAEEPLGQLTKDEARPAAPGVLERKGRELSAPQEKKTGQAPGYKSLDMKYSYEKPAPPVPAAPGSGITAARDETAVSAPAKRAAPMTAKEEAAAGATQAAPPAAATSMRAEQAAPARESARATGKAERTAKTLSAADRDAEDSLEVTEHFVRTDLPEKMKVQGLRFNTRMISDSTPDLQWLREMPAYRTGSCARRFLVDVELPGSSLKYLYCYDNSQVRLLGTFDLRNGTWSEIK